MGLYNTSVGPMWLLHVYVVFSMGQCGFVLYFRWANVGLMHTYSMGVFCWANVCLYVRACMRACVRACVEALNIGYIVYKQRAYNENIGLDC